MSWGIKPRVWTGRSGAGWRDHVVKSIHDGPRVKSVCSLELTHTFRFHGALADVPNMCGRCRVGIIPSYLHLEAS